jgi:hypothetical protein
VSKRGQSRPRLEPREGRYGEVHGGRWSSPWVIRIVVIVAAAILATALIYAAVNGVLFSVNSH